jgi:hypothetical protein
MNQKKIDENKLKSLDFAISQIEKTHGKGSIMMQVLSHPVHYHWIWHLVLVGTPKDE